MIYLESSPPNGPLHWNLYPRPYEPDGLTIRIFFGWERGAESRRLALQEASNYLRLQNLRWVVWGSKEWTVDLDSLVITFPHMNLSSLSWLRGRHRLVPEIERVRKSDQVYHSSRGMAERSYGCLYLVLTITPEDLKEQVMGRSVPPEIQESLAEFRADYPNDAKTAFIMMKFGRSDLHEKIVEGIKSTLEPLGIIGLRADDKAYHDDLFSNILTYIYGCNMGIAVFERIDSNDFNPNVSLEVGYMMGIRRPVCFLKDQTLASLHSDLAGKLYRSFSTQDPVKSIPPVLRQWLSDKGLT